MLRDGSLAMEEQTMIYTPGSSEDQKPGCDINRHWRVCFMDQHNKNPSSLASVLYPLPICIQSREIFESLFVPCREKRQKGESVKRFASGTSVGGHVQTDESVFRALSNRFVKDMAEVGLNVGWIKTKRNPWFAPTIARGMVYPPVWKPGCRIQFYCLKCIGQGHFGLVANGRLLKDSNGNQVDISDYKLRLEEMYYHSAECNKKRADYYETYMDSGSVKIPVSVEWVFGSRYDRLVQKIENEHPKAGFNFSPRLNPDQIREWKKKNGYTANYDKQRNADWSSFGQLENFQNPSYQYDDRSFLLLPPGNPSNALLSPDQHLMSMGRLLFNVVTRLGIEYEVSPFVLDEEKVREMWTDGEWKQKSHRNYRDMWMSNPGFYLKFREISAFFGGNEREVVGDKILHQYCHVDGVHKIGTIDPNIFAPGSLLVPLCLEGTKMYILSPKNVVDVPLGRMLVYKANLPHGGITRRLDGGKQCVAIHGHLDSAEIERKATLVGVSAVDECYIEEEHMVLYSVTDHMRYILRQHEKLKSTFRHFCETRSEHFEGEKGSTNGHQAANEDGGKVACRFWRLVNDLKDTDNYRFLSRKRKKCG